MLKEFIRKYIAPVSPDMAKIITEAFLDLYFADRVDRPLLYNHCVVLCTAVDVMDLNSGRHDEMIDAFNELGTAIMSNIPRIKEEIRTLIFEGVMA